MKRDVEEPSIVTTPPAESRSGGRKFVGNALFVLLIAVAAVAGAISGLVLVYSTDLPQVTELEHFRPSTITQPPKRSANLGHRSFRRNGYWVCLKDHAPSGAPAR